MAHRRPLTALDIDADALEREVAQLIAEDDRAVVTTTDPIAVATLLETAMRRALLVLAVPPTPTLHSTPGPRAPSGRRASASAAPSTCSSKRNAFAPCAR